jgi:adrenodoxin-NADP+ reductase
MLPWRGLRCQTQLVSPERIVRRVRFPLKHIYQARYKHDHHAQDGGHRPPTVAIIGSGPAGFYTAQKLMRDIDGTAVDMYEQLPVPFGLVRFGVAPDHPEVKNCQDTFNDVASSPNYRFIGNISLGHDLPLPLLAKHYDAIVFAYGASKDSQLGLEGENKAHVYSARAFVGWYNGLPEYRDLNPDLSAGETAIIIGQGNVALDVARILLQDIRVLLKTDITSHALEALFYSKIKHVRVVGRRGPLQAAFTIKEVRELMNLPNVNFTPIPDSLLPADLSKLPRPKKRLLELLKKGSPPKPNAQKSWSLDFLLSPTALEFSSTDPAQLTGVTFTRNTLLDPDSPTSSIKPTSEHTFFETSTLFRSIGYKATPIPGTAEIGALFNEKTGTLAHDGTGRILRQTDKQHSNTTTARLYCSGWVKRGPTGVIASTMTDAFETAEAIVADWRAAYSSPNATTTTSINTNLPPSPQLGWEAVKASAAQQYIPLNPVHWVDWEKIDAVERREGAEKGKPREKRTTVQGMLDAKGEGEIPGDLAAQFIATMLL